ncbi:hypothetical protein KJ359_011585 [Pestalotiopsis sp. 9143b]|nr:hypothetical protein KJ359_011585 [Pestalotiopsis sp. 9143b]
MRRRFNVEKKFHHLAKLAKRGDPEEDTCYVEALHKLKALESEEKKLLFILQKEQDRHSQDLDGDEPSSAQFDSQRLVDFEAHLRKYRHPAIEPVQQTAPTSSSASATGSKKRARSASPETNPEKRQKSSCHDVSGDMESAIGPPSVSEDFSVVHEHVTKMKQHVRIFPDCPEFSRKALKLVRQRKDVNSRLCDAEKQLRRAESKSVDEPVDDESLRQLRDRVKKIHWQRNVCKRKEKALLKEITEAHERAKSSHLGGGSDPDSIRKEAQLRSVLESFNDCLEHIRKIHRKTAVRFGQNSKKSKRDNASQPATLNSEPSDKEDATLCASPDDENHASSQDNDDSLASPENEDENHASLESHNEKHASSPDAHNETVELEERRRRMAQIVAPFLEDDAIVYDVAVPMVTPRGRPRDRRLMSGGRSPRKPPEVDGVSSGRFQWSSPKPVAQDSSPTEQTLKARRQSSSKTTTPRVLPDGSPSSAERGEPTRIIGPLPPMMGDIMFGSPRKLFDCRDQEPSATNEDPFTDANTKSIAQGSGSRTSSLDRAGKNVTPIPRPLPPHSLATSAGQGQIKRESSTTPRSLESLSAHSARAGTEPSREAKPPSKANTPHVKQQVPTDPRSLLHSLPGSAEGNRIALEKEKLHWKNMLDL